jgi:hypothetical protein
LGGDQALLMPPGEGLNLNLDSYQSDKQFCPFLAGSSLHWVLLWIQGPHSNSPGRWIPPPPHQAVHWHLVGSPLGGRWETHPSDKGGDNSPSPQSQTIPSRNVAGVCYLRYRTLEAISRKQCFIMPAQTQRIHVQRLSSENKGVSLYIPLQAGYRSKKQGLIHIWLYLILLATLP